MCVGFLGIQFGFALQTSEISRIFQTLGASLDQMPLLWVAAPITGMLVQPLIGYCSDRTWTRLGRRRPYVLGGALVAAVALIATPFASTLWMAASLLWLMDASMNVSMEPFRALIGDQLPVRQRPLGYAMQSFFIGVGAVVASALPWMLERLGVSNQALAGNIPDTVRYAFQAGGVVLLLSVLWTVLGSGEAPLGDEARAPASIVESTLSDRATARRPGMIWACAGLGASTLIAVLGLRDELYLLSVAAGLYGLSLCWLSRTASRGALGQILDDVRAMPRAMRQLAWVQLFSWFAMFSLWIYGTSAVAQAQFGSSDPHAMAYNQAANWVGVLFAAYNGFAGLAAMAIPLAVRRFGLRLAHLGNLWLGGAALLSFLFIRNPHVLLLPMLGLGMAWASILSLPYAMLADQVPSAKMGVYMGIFNFFIVIPQLVASSVLGTLLKTLMGNQSMGALALGGVSLLVAGLCTLRVEAEPAPGRSLRAVQSRP